MDNKTIVRILCLTVGPIALVCLLALILYYVHYKDMPAKEDGSLRYPLLFRRLPFLLFLIFIFGSALSFLTQGEEWLGILLTSMLIELPCLMISVCVSLWKVTVYEDRFEYRNFIGHTKTFLFSAIEERSIGKWYDKATQRLILRVPDFIPNDGLLRRRYKKYQLKTK